MPVWDRSEAVLGNSELAACSKCFANDEGCWLADGWHRHGGAERAGLTEIEVIRHPAGSATRSCSPSAPTPRTA